MHGKKDDVDNRGADNLVIQHINYFLDTALFLNFKDYKMINSKSSCIKEISMCVCLCLPMG